MADLREGVVVATKAPQGLRFGSWWPVTRFVQRGNDDALIWEIVDWRESNGKPPTGFVKADGSLTRNPADAYVFPVEDTHGSVSPQAVRAMLKVFAQANGRPIERGDMDTALQAELSNSIPYDGVDVEGRTTTFPSHGGHDNPVELPGITVEDEGNALGTDDSVTEINFVGAGVTATRTANKAVVTISGGTAAQH